MQSFRQKGLFIILALGAFVILALASYSLSSPPNTDTLQAPQAEPR